MTHQSWIWVHKDFQQDEGVLTLIEHEIHFHRTHVLTVGSRERTHLDF